MSGTRRTPIRRRHTPPVSLAAVKIFREMLRCRCGERYWELSSHLHRELRCKPWEQAVEDPDAGNPEPAGTYNYERWRPDEGARARWRALEEALGSREILKDPLNEELDKLGIENPSR